MHEWKVIYTYIYNIHVCRSVSLYSQDYTTTVLSAIVKLFVLLQNDDVTNPDCLVTVDLTTCKASVVKKSLPNHFLLIME